jgi:hypothetical protein
LLKNAPTEAFSADFGILNRGGVIMQGTELVVRAALCFAVGFFHISMKNSHPGSAETIVLVCGQSIS